MSFLTPIFLLLGLLAVPVILLYMLRLRRQELLTSSTMLWSRLVRDREANAPWQRLSRNLLLLLQLLILTALVLALARPFIPVPTIVSGNVVVLLDGSASMLANDVSPNRFAVAQELVEEAISDLSGSDQMTLILAGRQPTVLASASEDKQTLRRTLMAAEAEPVIADWDAAFALAAGTVQGFQEARIVVVSDGGLPDTLPQVPAEVIYLPVGQGEENLALSALAARESGSEPQLFASVTNYGRRDHQALMSITVDGTLFDSRRLIVPAGDQTSLTFTLPQGAQEISASLDSDGDDHLTLDDKAWATRRQVTKSRTLIVGPGNRFLETALSVLPALEPVIAPPNSIQDEPPAGEFDLVVLDSITLPDPLPGADMLIINPVGESADGAISEPPILVTGLFSNTAVVQVAESPLLTFVDWADVNILRAKRIEAPWARPLVMAEGGPLLLAGDLNGRRVVILTFQLQESDLPLQIAFPVLMANITNWLEPGQAIEASSEIRPGDPVVIVPQPGSTAARIDRPDGAIWSEPFDDEALIFGDTGQLGLYRVALRDLSGERSAGAFAVNLFAPSESSVAPVRSIRLGPAVEEAASGDKVGQRHFWPWLAGVALFILMIEWWVFHRGARLPRIRQDTATEDFTSRFRRSAE